MKRFAITLLCIFTCLSLDAQNRDIPKDFSFALTWGTYGICYYDSQTGVLIKDSEATDPKVYTTYYSLTDANTEYVYNLLKELFTDSYPTIYNPTSEWIKHPSTTLIITAFWSGKIRIIKAEDICDKIECADKKGQKFISTCNAISNMLMETEEWKQLPELERFFE